MPAVITTCAKCSAQYSWNTDYQEYPDCPRCGYNAMKIDKAKRDACSSAAARGDMTAVKKALGDPDVSKNLNAGPLTILHHAVLGNQIEVVRFLLKEGAKPDIAYPNAGNETPLHIAASKGYLDIAKLLIDSGARVDAKNSSGAKPIDQAADDATRALLRPYDDMQLLIGDFFDAIKAGQVDKVEEFLRRGVDPNVKDPNSRGTPPLCYAMGSQTHGKQLAEVLLRHGADPNVRRNAGITALHDAATDDRVDLARLLIEHGADVNIRDQNVYERTPLHTACDKGRLDIIKLLVEKGADVNARNKEGDTPLHDAAMYIASQKPEKKAQCSDEDFALLKVLLDAGGALRADQLPVVWVTDMKAAPNPAILAYLKSYAQQNPGSPQATALSRKGAKEATSRKWWQFWK